MPGLAPLNKRYGSRGSPRLAVACLGELRKLWSMSQEKPFIWKSSLGGPMRWVGWSVKRSPGWDNQCYQVVVVSDMALACRVCGSLGEGSGKGQWPAFLSGESYLPAFTLMPATSLSPCMPFKLLPRCWSSEGVSVRKSVRGFLKRNCLGLQKCLPPTQSPLILAATSYGGLSSWHWNPGLGGLVWGWDSSLWRYPS